MTTTIVTRSGKGSPLTNTELDANFTNLKTTADAALPAAGGTISGSLIITSDLEVRGTTTSIDSTTVEITDLNITLAKDATNNTQANGAGITIAGSNAELKYVSTGDKWTLNKNLQVTGTIEDSNGTFLPSSSVSTFGGTLIDDADAATARTTLGLGSAATSATSDFLAISGGTLTGTLAFGDSTKLKFGNSQDLEIYHDGSNSYISEVGEGSLKIQSTSGLALQDSSGNNFAVFTDEGTGGKVELYKSSTVRLTTTTSGIDVTGDVNATALNLGDNSTNEIPIAFLSSSTDFALGANGNNFMLTQSTGDLDSNPLLTVSGGGNVNIPNGSLMIGATTAPSAKFQVQGSDSSDVAVFHGTTGGNARGLKISLSGEGATNQVVNLDSMQDFGILAFKTAGTERGRFNSSGLSVTGSVTTDGLINTDGNLITTKTGNGEVIRFGRSTDNFRFSSIFHNSSDAGQAFIDFKVHDGSTANSQLQVLSLKGTGNVNIPNGKLMVGSTTAPSDKMEIVADSGHLRLKGSTTATKGLALLFDNSNNRSEIRSDQAGVNQLDLQYYALNHNFGRNASNITMHLSDDNKVGIGTDSPDVVLDVIGTTSSGIRIKSQESASNGFNIFNDSSNDIAHLNNFFNGPIVFSTNNTERMRIDSSGNLLVGTTSQISSGKISVAGGTNANGITATTSATSGFASASFQRTASDGQLIQFKKGSSEVGSILSRSGAVTTMIFDPRTNGSGISGTTNGLIPTNQSGTPTNNHVDLGSTTNKFKDLHLSGVANATELLVRNDVAGSPTRIKVSNGGTVQSGTASRLSFYEGATETSYIERRRDATGITAFVTPANDNPFVFESTGSIGEFARFTNGRLGLGTTSPLKPFHVNSATGNIGIRVESSDATSSIEFMDNGTTSTALSPRVGGISDDLFVQTSGVERMRIDSSGNVGIGETDPDSTLTVKGSGHTNFQVKSGSESTKAFIQTVQDTDIRIGSSTNHSLAFYTNGTEKMRITGGGNVAIGTTSVQGRFHSYISATRQLTHNGNGADLSIISDNNTNPVMLIKGTGTADLLNVLDNTTEVFTILDGGNVGVGQTVPDAFAIGGAFTYLAVGGTKPGILNLVDDSTNGSYLQFGTNAGVRRASIHAVNGSHLAFTVNASNSGTGLTEAMRIKNNGNVGIGTQSPDTLVHLSKASGGAVLRLENPDTGVSTDEIIGKIEFEQQDNGGPGVNSYIGSFGANVNGGAYLAFGTGTSPSNLAERLRIDSSGNLLVAGTDTNPVGSNVVGHNLANDGRVQHSITGNTVMKTNQTSDGDIIQFRKSGSAVGSIGTGNSGNLYIGSGDAGINFNKDVNSVYPINVDTGGATDGTLDLGLAAYRYKDLYLSGHIHMLGNDNQINGGAALYLDSDNTVFRLNNETEIMRFSGTNVGIGTTTPHAKLFIASSTDDALTIQNTTYQGSGQNTETAIRFKATAGVGDDERAKAGILLKNDGSAFGRGDLHFLVDSNDDNGNAVLADSKMVITHEGDVGIGTTSPTHTLQVHTASTGAFINRTTASNAANLAEFSANRAFTIFNRASGSYLVFGGNSARTDIQATDLATSPTAKNIHLNPHGGNIGIGTGQTAPDNFINTGNYFKPSSSGTAKFLTIDGGTSAANIILQGNITGENPLGGIYWTSTNGQSDAHRQVAAIDVQIDDHSSATLDGGSLRFFTKPAGGGVQNPRMTLLSNGNLIFGKTADNDNSAGIRFQSNGSGDFVRDNNVVLQVNRLTGDGNLMEFRKDSSLIGSLGNNTDFFIASQDGTGLRFQSDKVLPCDEGGNLQNGSRSLGTTSYRFKDAHFSGTVNAATEIKIDAGAVSTQRGFSISHTGMTGNVTKLEQNAGGNPHGILHTTERQLRISAGSGGGTGTSETLSFWTNASRAMTISTSQNVMIGATTPRRDLLIGFTSTDTNTSSTSSGFGNSSNVGNGVMINNTSTTDNTYAPLDFLCGSTIGRIAYKSINQADEFGQFEFLTVDDGSAVNALIIASNGNGTFAGSCTATSFPTSSDARLKSNIEDADDFGETIDAIKVRQYDWKSTGKHQNHGMIAQELQKIVPEAVSGDAKSEEMMGIDYSKLVPMLVKEIQSLRQRVAQLEE